MHSIRSLFLSFLYVQLVVLRSLQGFVLTEITDDKLPQEKETKGESEIDDYSENGDSFYEPFDPETNGFLMHEYYTKVYERYPEYDTTTLKQSLNYFGDVLLLGKDNVDTPDDDEEVDLNDQFVLDPAEKELYLKLNETEETVVVEGIAIENDEVTLDVGDINVENEHFDDWDLEY